RSKSLRFRRKCCPQHYIRTKVCLSAEERTSKCINTTTITAMKSSPLRDTSVAFIASAFHPTANCTPVAAKTERYGYGRQLSAKRMASGSVLIQKKPIPVIHNFLIMRITTILIINNF
ncbi:unnamed protein product, partial [Medioppia subpectinata]